MSSLSMMNRLRSGARNKEADIESAAPKEEPWAPPPHGRLAYATKMQLLAFVPVLVLLACIVASHFVVIHPRSGQPHLTQSLRLSTTGHMAMQMACKEGLRPAPDDKRRFQIRTILNGNSILGESLRSVWENKTPEEAHDVLAQQDVTVTNQSDKLKQLPKLRQLNDMVVDVMAGKSRSLLA